MKKYKQIDGFYIADDEEHLMKYLMPEHYFESEEADAEYVIRFLQNELNSILNSFINGGFSKKGFVFFPAHSAGLSPQNRFSKLGHLLK